MSMLRVVLAALLAVPAWAGAEALRCPDVSVAVQVGTCPSEAELAYTFGAYCGDNKRMYEIGDTVCESYENYRRFKNVVLWESADGQFDGYVSCDLPAAALRAAVLERMTVSSKRGLTRVACGYSDGVNLAHRTRAACEIEDVAGCAADASACQAECQ